MKLFNYEILPSSKYLELQNELYEHKLRCLDLELELEICKSDLNKVYKVMNIFEKIPDIEEMFEVFKYMTPMMKEKLVEYFSYAGIALAQDSLEQENKDVER